MKKCLPLFLFTFLFTAVFAQKNVGIGTTSPVTKLDIEGALSLREGATLVLSNGGAHAGANDNITLPAITGTTDISSFYRITGPSTTFSIYGITPVSGADGQMVTLINTTGKVMTIINNNSAGTGSGIITQTGGNLVDNSSAAANSSITLQYNKTAGLWYVTATQNYAITNLQGNPVSNVAPTSGQVLEFSSGSWTPVTPTLGTITSIGVTVPSSLLSVSPATITSSGTFAFSLANAGAYTVFGNNTNSSAAPTYFSPVLNSALFQNQGTTTTILHGNASGNPAWGAVNLGTDVTGTLPNANLTNSSVTITSTGTGLSVSGSPVALGGTVTIASNATAANTASTIVSRDASGNFSTGTITATLSGSVNTPTATGLTATGTTLANALVLTADYNQVSTTASGTGVVLPTAVVGRSVYIVNRGANTLNVYPATGAAIDGLSANTAFVLPVNGALEFKATTTSQWYSTTDNLPVTSFNSGTGASATTYWTGNGTWSVPAGTGVSSFSAGTTGFTPNTATAGAVTLAGILNTANGGLGANMTAGAIGAIPYATSTTTYGTLPAVAAGNVLVSNGTGAPPSWSSNNGLNWTLKGNGSISQPAVPATYGTSTFSSTENFIGNTDAKDLTFGTSNLERMRILSTGKIGIGTAAPQASLMVYSGISNTLSTANVGTAVAVFDGGSGSANSRVIIGSNWLASGTRPESQLEFWNNAFGGVEGNGATISTVSSQGGSSGQVTANLVFSTANSATSPTERMRITNTGNVGIGTSAPFTTLDVLGNIITSNHGNASQHDVSEQGTSYIGHESGTVGLTAFAGMGIKVAPGNNSTANAGIIQFYTWGNSVSNSREIVRIDERGYLGIGTTAPSSKLYVLSADNAYATNIATFMANNLTYGVAIAYGGIRPCGTNSSNPLYIDGQGGGNVNLQAQQAGNIIIGDGTNNSNPYILPASSTFLRIGNSSNQCQDIYSNYFYALGRIMIGSSSSPNCPLHVTASMNGTGATSVSDYIAYINNTSSGSQAGGILVNVSANGNGDRYLETEVNGSETGCLYGNGSNTLQLYTASDERLKTNITNTALGLNTVMKMKVRNYQWKADGKSVNAGFIAQELYNVYPEAVSKGSEGELDSKAGGTWMVNYAGITPLLTKAIQDQQAEIEQLKKENETLQSKLEGQPNAREFNKLKAQLDDLKTLMEKNGIRAAK